ncbi:MAG TPA: hypothetical protein VMT79_10945 [Candidatus Binatia bacterium]|nr:hypothetical protein [Candidatus Binatia bacterium]
MRVPGWLAAAVSATVVLQLFAAVSPVASQENAVPDPQGPFVICSDQRYALCAEARCTTYNGVAYCECVVLRGDSISLQLDIPTPDGEKNVCDVNAQGKTHGYMVSTYSLPPDAEKGGSSAAYTCPGTANQGSGVPAPVAYGQCDGGICFTSTTRKSLDDGELQREITCSCPISTSATPGSADALGYQIFGPYHPQAPVGQRCDPSGCAACSVPNPTANGSVIPVGAPTGSGRLLTELLLGSTPPLNECLCECPADGPCTVRDDTTQ